MVFVYFKKARLHHSEYTRETFFKALYLAHEIEEDTEENRWEILPWALGRSWRYRYISFQREKNELWRKLDFRGVVSRRACDQVMGLRAFSKHWAFARQRKSVHANIKRLYPNLCNTVTYKPHGPVWQTEAGRAWLRRSIIGMRSGHPTIRMCEICYGANETMGSKVAM